jgi:HlyD family secretion protein
MSETSQNQIFRAAAIERLSSPEQLEEFVRITRPADWLATLVICLALAAIVTWGILGTIPTRVTGEGMLIGDGGAVVDAVSATGSRLSSVDVAVGDVVRQGQTVARLSQTEAEQRHRNALEVLEERERERQELAAATEKEIATKRNSFAAQKAALAQVIAIAEERASVLAAEVKTLEGMVSGGLATQPQAEEKRVELYAVQQRITDAKSDLLRIDAQSLDLETQRDHDRMEMQFRVNDARREANQLDVTLARDSQLLSPADGRVTEVKVSPGAVLAAGTPVLAIETAARGLRAVIFLPADQGKTIKGGMEVRVEPSTVKREEYGSLIGTVESISEFPVTPERMDAVLHNVALVSRFSNQGPLFECVVALKTDAAATSGYRWSSGVGPPLILTEGTLARAEITTRERPPIDLVIPLIKRLVGVDG